MSKRTKESTPRVGKQGDEPESKRSKGTEGCVTTISIDNPDLDYVLKAMDGYKLSYILYTASELHIFDHLYEMKAPTAAALAKAQGWNPDFTERLLNTLVATKFLQKSKDSSGKDLYTLTNVGDMLRKGAPDSQWSYAQDVKMFAEGYADLVPIIKGEKKPEGCCGSSGHDHSDPEPSGGEEAHHTCGQGKDTGTSGAKSQVCKHGRDPEPSGSEKAHHTCGQGKDTGTSGAKSQVCKHGVDHSAPDYEQRYREEIGEEEEDWGHGEETYKMFDGLLRPTLRAILDSLDLSSYHIVVDLGGGSGLLCYELCRKYPQMKTTLFEMPSVINETGELRKQFAKEVKANVDIIKGDFIKDGLPKADLFVLCQVITHWSQADSDVMFSKIHKALNKGGAILLLEETLEDSKDGPMSAHIWDMYYVAATEGRMLSGSEYKHLLAKHGFTDNFQMIKTQGIGAYDAMIANKK